MNFIIYTRYIKENSIIPPFTHLFSLAISPLSRHSLPRHSSLVTRHFFPFSVTTFPLIEVASDNWVCALREIFITFPSSFVSRHSSFHYFFRHTPPIAYGLRPSTSSSFFRLETPFLTFLTLLYYIMSQLLIHPFYTNRPRFV